MVEEMHTKIKWIWDRSHTGGGPQPETQQFYDDEVEHSSYQELHSKLSGLKPDRRISHIVRFNLAEVDRGGDVRTLDAGTYGRLTEYDYLYVFCARSVAQMESELAVLESLHKRILRLENMKAM